MADIQTTDATELMTGCFTADKNSKVFILEKNDIVYLEFGIKPTEEDKNDKRQLKDNYLITRVALKKETSILLMKLLYRQLNK